MKISMRKRRDCEEKTYNKERKREKGRTHKGLLNENERLG